MAIVSPKLLAEKKFKKFLKQKKVSGEVTNPDLLLSLQKFVLLENVWEKFLQPSILAPHTTLEYQRGRLNSSHKSHISDYLKVNGFPLQRIQIKKPTIPPGNISNWPDKMLEVAFLSDNFPVQKLADTLKPLTFYLFLFQDKIQLSKTYKKVFVLSVSRQFTAAISLKRHYCEKIRTDMNLS